MRKTEAAFLAAVAGFLIGFCLLGLFRYEYSWDLMRFPLLAAGVTLALAVARLAVLRSAPPPARAAGPPLIPAPTHATRPAGSGRRAALVRMLWLFSAVPLVFVFGYPGGLAIYLLCVLRHSGEGWTVSLGVALGSLLVSWGLFVEVLGVALPLAPPWWPLPAG